MDIMVHAFVMKRMPPIASPLPRRVVRSTRAILASGIAALVGACESEPESHVVSAPPPAVAVASAPVVVTSQTTTTQTQPVVLVPQAPPAVQTDVVVPRPSPDYVWIAGYWTWRDSRYEWVAGHWELPPRANAAWVPPHWEPESGGVRFYEGYWN